MRFEKGKNYDLFLSQGLVFRDVEYLKTTVFEDGTVFVDILTDLGQIKSINIKTIDGYNVSSRKYK